MAKRNQPYLPLYVQDFMTDEKLAECSPSAHGVYIRIMCLLHKQETYGAICLKQKHKQNQEQIKNFALMLALQMPFTQEQIQNGLTELIDEGVLHINGDTLYQKRMVKDGEISNMRSKIGKTGGSSVTKQYGKNGYLYLMSDGYTKHKIGISTNPQNRLYRLRSDLKLPKHFEIIKTVNVTDMGSAEDFAQLFFKDIIDGEWLIGEYNVVIEKFVLLEANLKAKSKADIQAKSEANSEIENENINEDIITNRGVQGGFGLYSEDLDEVEIGGVIEFMAITAKRRLTPEQINQFWKAFLIHSNHEYHRNRPDKLQHFRNWLKKQPDETKSASSANKSNTASQFDRLAAKVAAGLSQISAERAEGFGG